MVNPDKIYPLTCRLSRTSTPLVRIPEPMSITEKIGGHRNTPSTPISEKTGGTCLQRLRDIFRRSAHGDMDFYDDGELGVTHNEE